MLPIGIIKNIGEICGERQPTFEGIYIHMYNQMESKSLTEGPNTSLI